MAQSSVAMNAPIEDLITKVPITGSCGPTRSKGNRSRSSCYNFKAVSQAHKEMAIKRGKRRPPVTRFDLTEKVTETPVIIVNQLESLAQEPVTGAVTQLETSSELKSEKYAIGAPEDSVITGFLQLPYESFGLPEGLNKRTRLDKPIRQSLKSKVHARPSSATINKTFDRDSILSNVSDSSEATNKATMPGTTVASGPSKGVDVFYKYAQESSVTSAPVTSLERNTNLAPFSKTHRRNAEEVAICIEGMKEERIPGSDTKASDSHSSQDTLSMSSQLDVQMPRIYPDESPTSPVSMHKTSLYVSSTKQSKPSGSLEVSNLIAQSIDRGSAGSDLKTQSNPRNRPIIVTRSRLGPVRQDPPIKLKESDFNRDRTPLAPKDLNTTVADTSKTRPSDGAQKDEKASGAPFEARGFPLIHSNPSPVMPFDPKATQEPDSELIRNVFSLVSCVHASTPDPR